MRLRRALTTLAVVAAALAACTAQGDPAPDRDASAGPGPTGCGPVAFEDVEGRAPRYVDPPIAPFANDHAVCAARWLPRTGTGKAFVPQGLVVRGRTAWVSGYDDGPVGGRLCRLLRLDLRTGRLVDQVAVAGSVGSRGAVACRHGGGLVADEHGLWLSEKARLWLLDPETLEVRRAWATVAPVWGSFVVHDPQGRIGLAGFDGNGPARMRWFEPGTLLADGVVDLTTALAVDTQPVPASGQGGFHADLGRGRPGVWFVRSTTRCGMLHGPRGQRLGLVPGAEGAALARRSLWVVSESTAAPYFLDGGRPVVPHVLRYDLSRVRDWERAACTP